MRATDTAQSVFGGASLLFDGTGDYVDTPVHARYDIGAISSASNHTWRFRARFAAAAPSSLGDRDSCRIKSVVAARRKRRDADV